jgi:helix-turn-helix protein
MTQHINRRLRENPADIATYTIADAAHHLRMPAATVRSWLVGRPYTTASGKKQFAPLVEMADRERQLLSFRDLVELHVLGVVRSHSVKVRQIRTAIDYLRDNFHDSHLLSSRQMLRATGQNHWRRVG